MKLAPELDDMMQALTHEEAIGVLHSLVICEWVRPKIAKTMICIAQRRLKGAPAKPDR